jgi:aspartyl-tRNA synthetase
VFAHGRPPYGGFAIGLERFTARLIDAGNIRSTTAILGGPGGEDVIHRYASYNHMYRSWRCYGSTE